MSPTPANYLLRTADISDRDCIQRFTQSLVYSHRHLDWREPLDWLGRQPFWILEKNGDIQAVLACIAEPEGVAWLRLFAVETHLSPTWAWSILFEKIYQSLAEMMSRPTIAVLGLQDWFSELLITNGFVHFQDIIVLSYEKAPPAALAQDPALCVRKMTRADIRTVTRIDNQAFEPLWRLSEDDLGRAFERSTYKTVIEQDGQIAGYQMSAHNGFTAHLARLAVDPAFQRRRFGYRLVQDVLEKFVDQNGVWGVTLNTQNDNHVSLAFYQQIGFHLTGESFPVYVYPYRK
jgi:ribosomal protein S18 acetylase RimI-like enzyme